MLSLALVGQLVGIKPQKSDFSSYAGDDDATDAQCQIQSVPNILEGNILDHVSVTLRIPPHCSRMSNILKYSLVPMKGFTLAHFSAHR